MQKLMQKSEMDVGQTDAKIPPLHHRSKMLGFAEAVTLKKYDKNGDGSLTKDEWSSMSKDHAAADFDGDGKITATEFAKWRASNNGKTRRAMMKGTAGCVVSTGGRFRCC